MNKSYAMRLVRSRQNQKENVMNRVDALRDDLRTFRMLEFHCSDAETHSNLRNAIIVCVKQLRALGYAE